MIKIKRRVDSTLRLDPMGSFSITLRPSSYKKVLDNFNINKNSNILEIGCGKGHALYYCSLFYNVEYILGIDFQNVINLSENIFNIYKKKYPNKKLDNIELQTIDFLKVDAIPDYFTHIICIIESKIVLNHLLKISPKGVKIATIIRDRDIIKYIIKEKNGIKIPVKIENGSRTIYIFKN